MIENHELTVKAAGKLLTLAEMREFVNDAKAKGAPDETIVDYSGRLKGLRSLKIKWKKAEDEN